MSELMAKILVKRILDCVVPQATNHVSRVGEKVHVWRDDMINSRTRERLGPIEVEGIDDTEKIAHIRDDVNPLV